MLTARLPQLWALVWTAGCGEHSDRAAALQFACALFRAHAELRQLDSLLAGLFASLPPLLASAGGGNTDGSGGSGSGGRSFSDIAAAAAATNIAAAAASRLLTSRRLLHALRSSVAQAPAGQAPALVQCVAHGAVTLLAAPRLGDNADADEALLPLLAAALFNVLEAVTVDLTTAVPVAAALRCHLLEHPTLWKPLVAAAAAAAAAAAVDAAASGGMGSSDDRGLHGRRAALLRLFSAAAQLHARCAALDPAEPPLPGHDIRPAAIDDQWLQAIKRKEGSSGAAHSTHAEQQFTQPQQQQYPCACLLNTPDAADE